MNDTADRRLRVWSERHDPPQLRALARAFLDLAAEQKACANAGHDDLEDDDQADPGPAGSPIATDD